MSRIIAIIRINDTFGWTSDSLPNDITLQYENNMRTAFPVNWRRDRVSLSSTTETNRNKIKYESDLWLYNRNLMKMLFPSIFRVKFSNFIRFRHFANGCCCEVIRSFFSEVFVWFLSSFHIPITSHTYRSFSFVYLFVMKFILSFMALALYLNAKTALPTTIRLEKCQKGKRKNVIRKTF